MHKYFLALAMSSVALQAHAVGISLGIGNVFGQYATQAGTQPNNSSVDQVLQQISSEWNEKMPISVEPTLRLDKVSAEPGKHFTFHYTVDGKIDAGGTSLDFSRELKPQLKDQLCSSTENQKFLRNGITVAYQYRDHGGRPMGNAEFSPTDCGFKF
jgi:hypothetical protein